MDTKNIDDAIVGLTRYKATGEYDATLEKMLFAVNVHLLEKRWDELPILGMLHIQSSKDKAFEGRLRIIAEADLIPRRDEEKYKRRSAFIPYDPIYIRSQHIDANHTPRKPIPNWRQFRKLGKY